MADKTKRIKQYKQSKTKQNGTEPINQAKQNNRTGQNQIRPDRQGKHNRPKQAEQTR